MDFISHVADFATWKAQLVCALVKVFGVSTDDAEIFAAGVGDAHWLERFRSGVSPGQAAAEEKAVVDSWEVA